MVHCLYGTHPFMGTHYLWVTNASRITYRKLTFPQPSTKRKIFDFSSVKPSTNHQLYHFPCWQRCEGGPKLSSQQERRGIRLHLEDALQKEKEVNPVRQAGKQEEGNEKMRYNELT